MKCFGSFAEQNKMAEHFTRFGEEEVANYCLKKWQKQQVIKALVKGDDITDAIYPSTFQACTAYLMKKTGQYKGTVQSLFFLKWSHIF